MANVQHHEHRIIPDHRSHPHVPARIPNIPDLRFENSYIRSISPFVQIRRPGLHHAESPSPKEPDYEVVNPRRRAHALQEVAVPIPSEEIVVNWSKVLWITTRDQVLSPFIQGAVWGIAGYFIVPLLNRLRSRSAQYVRNKRLAMEEGRGVAWLRDWLRGLSSVAPSHRKFA